MQIRLIFDFYRQASLLFIFDEITVVELLPGAGGGTAGACAVSISDTATFLSMSDFAALLT
jgi:hypothetical protein